MNRLPRPLLLSCLLALGCAHAAPPAPAPARPPARTSACALALQQQQEQQQAAAPRPAGGRKVNMDFLFDPCKLTDTDQDSDIANNEGEPPKDEFETSEDWVEWNRQQAEHNGVALLQWFGYGDEKPGSDAAGQHSDEWWQHNALGGRQGHERELMLAETAPGLAPAVPEPAAILLWLAGLPLLAFSYGKARRAARR